MSNSAFNLDKMVVPTKAATIYQAHEASLFLPGAIIPSVNVPAGSASLRVPVLSGVAATKITSESANADGDVTPDDSTSGAVADIAMNIYAARNVLRDLSGIDPAEVGRLLGNAVAKKFDEDCIAQLESTDITNEVDTAGTVTLPFFFDAIKLIRDAGEMGQLNCVVSTAMATNLMKTLGDSNFNVAAGDYASEALRNGFMGRLAGVNMFMSSYMTANQGTIFAQDAFRMGMHKDVDVEIARRAAAVGNDVVASLHAGVGLVDASRAVRLYDVA